MMAHVAEASESSGRVLFWTDRGSPSNPVAAQAAARLAASFNAEIETVAIGPADLSAMPEIPCARVVRRPSAPGPGLGDVEHAAIADTLSGRRQRRDVATIAGRYGVNCTHTEATGDAVDVLSELCLMRGPWNVVVAGARTGVSMAGTLFANVSGATGMVAAPSRAANPDGSVAAIIEDTERLPAMLRAAMRLTRMFGRIHLVPVASSRAELEQLQSHARLAASSHRDLVVESSEPGYGSDGVYDTRLRRLNASYIVSRFGGTLLPSTRALARTIEIAAAPFLLVR